MSRAVITAAIVSVVLLAPTGTVSAVTQDAERGTTLVCVNEGGDAMYVDEWTAEKVAEDEARTGRDMAGEFAVDPATGDCTDFAGLVRGWFVGTSWLCTRDAAGHWRGPSWIWSMYRPDSAVPPEPATGRCPQRRNPYPYGEERTELQRAAATAVHLTELEVAGDYDRLYAWMHPDAQAVVPQEVMRRAGTERSSPHGHRSG